MQVNLNLDVTDRFRSALGNLNFSKVDRLLCAVSGGPDSIALLLLAYETLPGRVAAVSIDHQLRPESAEEAMAVARLCSNLDIPHRILTPPHVITGNLQSSARAVRYTLLESAANELHCTHIATAHHADDQLETILMRLARGSGVDGLSAIRAQNGRVIRPLLGFTKAELVAICADANIETADDPSNANSDFDRVVMRQWLASNPHPFQPDRTTRTAHALAQASDALSWMADYFAEQRISRENDIVMCDPTGVPDEIKRRLLSRCLSILDAKLAPRGDAIDRLLTDLPNALPCMIGDIKCEGGAVWRFSQAPPRRSAK